MRQMGQELTLSRQWDKLEMLRLFSMWSRLFRVVPLTEIGGGQANLGGMAEWSIATVLKTVGLTAPGVRIPLPPLQRRSCLVVWGCGAQLVLCCFLLIAH